mgnify:FL=1
MMSSELEKQATQKARTVDPSVLPFTTSADDWQTWVSPLGQWVFIEKAVTAAVASAFAFGKDEAFQFVGEQVLSWLTTEKAPRPQKILKIEFYNRKDIPLYFGIFQNQCFIFMPRKID